jgi:hypothetical protein
MRVCCGVARIVPVENRRAGAGAVDGDRLLQRARLADRRGQRDLDIFAAAAALCADVVPTRITTAARARDRFTTTERHEMGACGLGGLAPDPRS